MRQEYGGNKRTYDESSEAEKENLPCRPLKRVRASDGSNSGAEGCLAKENGEQGSMVKEDKEERSLVKEDEEHVVIAEKNTFEREVLKHLTSIDVNLKKLVDDNSG